MYNDDTDNLYWEDDFDGSSKGSHTDDDPYTKEFGFHEEDADEDREFPTVKKVATDTDTGIDDDDEELENEETGAVFQAEQPEEYKDESF